MSLGGETALPRLTIEPPGRAQAVFFLRKRLTAQLDARRGGEEKACALGWTNAFPVVHSRPSTNLPQLSVASVLWSYHAAMATIQAEEVRIPRWVREAVAHHEEVVVFNRARPAFVIIHPDDHRPMTAASRRGRPLREALALFTQAALPDPSFAEDMQDVLGSVGPAPPDPWAPS
jgi:hypothetical protein